MSANIFPVIFLSIYTIIGVACLVYHLHKTKQIPKFKVFCQRSAEIILPFAVASVLFIACSIAMDTFDDIYLCSVVAVIFSAAAPFIVMIFKRGLKK